ncbi:hypothetical protein G1H11_23640 [Phytoactinopolyspora alkaliphila]|uniref:Uncharacterized protein n=1 Tax=Phytoactinopolyspora alkaliphila TaxID=1783498 RepID=A0A6N9YU13_9ACTN|nr:hypothetical protein [Phytoactinopolyspora alkaliphila]NED98298.1 hypothetical protein [Phytoactinopolyspora alkaliphila]
MMTVMFAAVIVVAVLGTLGFVSSAQRRADDAQRRAEALSEQNHRLERALGVAEQALRSLSHDTRLDAGMAVQLDAAIEDIRRAARGDDPSLGG